MTRCNGQDPAHPGLYCYLRVPHDEYPCEFTDAVGEVWRDRALKVETRISQAEDRITALAAAEHTAVHGSSRAEKVGHKAAAGAYEIALNILTNGVDQT